MNAILSKYDKYKLFGLIIKAITGVIGGSLVLTENHPYITLIVLSIGAGANEYISFIKDKEAKKINKKLHQPDYGC
jgi:divalent metal cation (Fe/Co/Zn/Cd) transporter